MLAPSEHLTVEQFTTRFGTDDAARQYLEGVRWPNGPMCPHCPNEEHKPIYAIPANPAKKVRAGLYECGACRRQFTVTIGTIFEDSKIPLHKWLTAWWMLCTTDKGMSALQMQRTLHLGSYRSAWFMMHRIRYALREPVFSDRLGERTDGGAGGANGRPRTSDLTRRSCGTRRVPGDAVVAVRSRAVKKMTGKVLQEMLDEKLHRPVQRVTDGLRPHRGRDLRRASHRTVAHPRQD
ncbi:transposase [Bradyrhizobium diazoefficiens]|nr:transposase [Bradyrhizobium diazoefficiens]MBR0773125.1 transposase [Bradyrhizobium diazoefficiens]